ncbi:MAG TPA: ribonuclease HII [Myxococcota bacterium]|nr:ribonuclease HII [Myxococcota bacterium]
MTRLIGLDEAGRGPLAGPVVVAACALPTVEHEALTLLDDSKRLDEATRDALFEPIRELAIGYAVAVIDHLTIDAMNILRASLHGMFVAWRELVTAHPELEGAPVLVDGRDRAPLPEHVLQRPLIKGDARSRNIAAASILAKVTRDRLMVQAHALYPHYGFDRHKGYPTPAHRKAIAEHGPCPIHRRSFSFVAEHDPELAHSRERAGERA